MAKTLELATEKVVRYEMQKLPVDLLPDERMDRGQKLAQAEDDLRQQQLRAEEAKRKLKAEESEISTRMAFYAKVVRENREPRDVRIGIYPHTRREGWVREVREDTGEVVRERQALEHEMQGSLL